MFTQKKIYTHKQPFSLSQTALLRGERDDSPSVPQSAKPELQRVAGGQPHVLSTPESGLFQEKALCNWLLFSFLFSMYLPGPQIPAPKLLIGNIGKELHLKKKMALNLVLGQLSALTSISMTAWVAVNIACDAACCWPRTVGPGQDSLPTRASSPVLTGVPC